MCMAATGKLVIMRKNRLLTWLWSGNTLIQNRYHFQHEHSIMLFFLCQSQRLLRSQLVLI